MAMKDDRAPRVHAFASKVRACFQTGAGYALVKVVPKAKVVLPYLLAYYVFPTIVSLVYTLVAQKYTIHHMYVDTQSLSDVEVCVKLPTLVVPGGTQVRNMRVRMGFGESDVHACTLVSHSLHKWKHLQGMHICEKMAIVHNDAFDAGDITAFLRERKNVWVLLELDLGVNLLLGSIYFRMSFKKSIDVFGGMGAKAFDIAGGTATEKDDAISAAVEVRPHVPAFLRFFAPGFSIEACGVVGNTDAGTCRLYVVSVEPVQWTEPGMAVSCTVRSARADIENIKDMQKVHRRCSAGHGG
ncbi:UNVERIFIED_CONTAM: hypothetical protein PYX00_011357 [Menopon gallinae]|uniref:Uncharacterized protein n=1 Tax=Menopon gallinae TaxID=328185 RepID=A0AAW2H7C8_9NEOP